MLQMHESPSKKAVGGQSVHIRNYENDCVLCYFKMKGTIGKPPNLGDKA
jgi:hypothetical protein